MISGSHYIVALLLTSVQATRTHRRVASLKGADLRGVSMHHSSFANFLSMAMQSDDFKQQAAKVVPYMCGDGDDPSNELCKKSITKSLLCTNFLEKAQSLQEKNTEGAANFIAHCKEIEKEVPNLRSVLQMVQNPEKVTPDSLLGAVEAMGKASDTKKSEAL